MPRLGRPSCLLNNSKQSNVRRMPYEIPHALLSSIQASLLKTDIFVGFQRDSRLVIIALDRGSYLSMNFDLLFDT